MGLLHPERRERLFGIKEGDDDLLDPFERAAMQGDDDDDDDDDDDLECNQGLRLINESKLIHLFVNVCWQI